MTDGIAAKGKLRGRLMMALAVFAVLVLALVVPPLISVNHYKSRITNLISQSFGRPVRLSSVQVRLLPWPGFEIYDLSVAEDPAYGAEPVLHASKVTASLRLLALWRGKLEIDKISVDEASMNLVRAGPGQWNLDPIFRTAAAQTGVRADGSAGDAQSSRAQRLPSLEATNSRIDFKNGAEKLPFSLVNADLSLWQAGPGEWRIRLRAQPARTDVSLQQEETGVVRMEASVRAAPALREMPVHMDLDWREARLGQLAQLITGSDSGWRGDLTGELHLDGTADAAHISTRLRASGVHREEFAPAVPLDFDANCGFVYHFSRFSLENLDCNSPLGDGRMHLTGEMPGSGVPPNFTLELDRIPVAAGLDALRTLRSGIDPGLEASGTASGKIVYDAVTGPATPAPKSANSKLSHPSPAEPASPLTGSLTIADFSLSGGGLSKPVQAPRFPLVPSAASHAVAEALTGTFEIPAGGDTPLAVNLLFSRAGYQVGVRGQVSIVRARELAHAAGVAQSNALAELAGDPVTVDLIAAGPWIPREDVPVAVPAATEPDSTAAPQMPPPASAPAPGTIPDADSLTGTLTLRNAYWKADYLASHVKIDDATLHLDGTSMRWGPVDFSYGPLKGTASLSAPLDASSPCTADLPEPQACRPQFQIQFGELDASTLESALLGAQEKSTMLSDLINRLHPSASPPWPALEGTIKADSLVLGPVTLHDLSAALRVLPASVEVVELDAGIFDGSIHAAGSLVKPATDQDKPAYTFEGDFQKLDAASFGALLGLRWTGSPLSGNGKIDLSGYSAADLVSSAHGELHFECRHGAIGNQPSQSAKAEIVPAALGRFDRWSADAVIANGAVTLGQNAVATGAHKQSVQAKVTFGDPPVVSFVVPKQLAAKQR